MSRTGAVEVSGAARASYSRTVQTTIERVVLALTEELDEERSHTSYRSELCLVDGQPYVRQWSDGHERYQPQIAHDMLLPDESDLVRWRRTAVSVESGEPSIGDGVEHVAALLRHLKEDVMREYGHEINAQWQCELRTSLVFDSEYWGLRPSFHVVRRSSRLSVFEFGSKKSASIWEPEQCDDLAHTVAARLKGRDGGAKERSISGPCVWSAPAVEGLGKLLATALQNNHVNNYERLSVGEIGHSVLTDNCSVKVRVDADRVLDDEGLLLRERTLIDRGILEHCLLSLRRSYELGTPAAGGGTIDWLGQVGFGDTSVDVCLRRRGSSSATAETHYINAIDVADVDFRGLTFGARISYELGGASYECLGVVDLNELLECATSDASSGGTVFWTDDARYVHAPGARLSGLRPAW